MHPTDYPLFSNNFEARPAARLASCRTGWVPRGLFRYNSTVMARLSGTFLAIVLAGLLLVDAARAQQPPPASAARILLLPRKVVSGERATLAVLDVNGRLTPGVTVEFSNGDHLKTDATGRAMFVAPLNPGVVSASISGRPGKIYTTILGPTEVVSDTIELGTVPKIASLSDRFELTGRGFCGDADANRVNVGGQQALVLAASPTSLEVLPPPDLEPGALSVEISCAKKIAAPATIRFVALALEANTSPLAPGEHRTLTVRVTGTALKVALEARNLEPDVAGLNGGSPLRVSSSGGTINAAHFEIVGRKRGPFVISIRLLSSSGPPRSGT
jgi:hypothetical protein